MKTESLPLADPNKDKLVNVIKTEEDLPPKEKEGKLLFILGTIVSIFTLIIVVVLSVIYLKFPSTKSDGTLTPTPSPTVIVTQAPEKEIIKDENITFEVLNASGITGQAAKHQKQLEFMGYKVTSIGNAEGKYSGIEIFVNQELDAQKESLLSNIRKEFPSATISGELKNGTTMVRFIIGK